ncbi:Protease 1 precursor [Planctomycetes bacterium Poly30]|uniref:Protease 1 n=2 Tax=Saltatorellus ferox TaxID=2528018 RepID=A0A518EMA6_9BACT|nr:Protease 1 precursor [Planctomycetes bacterium Poly30]
MVMVQISDSQAITAADRARFEFVLSHIVEAGAPGALIPRRPDVILFPGDYVDDDSVLDQWTSTRDTIQAMITENGFPLIGTPGNHDQEVGGIARYEEYIADSGVWDFGSEWFTGQNGPSGFTGWKGLRFIGYNGSNGAWNVTSPSDLADVEARAAAASANFENIILVGHHRHNERGMTPMVNVLENSSCIGYMRGHLDQPAIEAGLSGITNPNVHDLNSNSVIDVGALLYYEIFPDRIESYVLSLAFGPTELPEPQTIWLQHPMVPVVPVAPLASFSASEVAGAAPLNVEFTDTSTGPATEWLWDFGDGAQSTYKNPDHTYVLPGVYTVTLTASNGSGSDVVVRTNLIDVSGSVPESTFVATADAMVKSSSANRNYGTDPELRVREGEVEYRSFLRFDVDGIGSRPITGAFLRLQVTDSSVDGGSVTLVEDDWEESSVTYATAPAAIGGVLDAVGSVAVGTFVEFDVSAGVLGEGVVSFGLANGSSDSALFSSREGSVPPELIVTLGAPMAPTVAFSANAVTGTSPMSVNFTDESTGGAVVWNWSFGDGGTSVAQNPMHTYMAPGTYSVTLTAISEGGTGSLTRTDLITVAPPIVPTAAFSSAPPRGRAPLEVTFTDESEGNPTAWLWDFGDGATSTSRNPVHVYTQPGSHTVTLTVSTTAGLDVLVKPGAVFVQPEIPTATFEPVADARVRSNSPNNNYGFSDYLQVRGGGTEYRSYLQFDVTGIGANPVSSAVLRLFVTDGTPVGGTVYSVGSGWTEGGITYANAPATIGGPIGSIGDITGGLWVEIDVTAAITGEGLHSFALLEGSTNSALYSSREGYQAPQLVLTLDTVTTATTISVADGQVKSSNPTTNYGDLDTLRIRGGSPSYASYLRFDVAGVGGSFVDTATLRLFSEDGSRSGGEVYFAASPWDEQGLTSGNAPSLVGAAVAAADQAISGGWTEYDLTGAVLGDGTLWLAVVSSSTDSAIFSSREGGNPPELVLALR